MNAKQKLHQSNLALWASRFKEQKESGLSIKSWCLENNISMYAFNYWKHIDATAADPTVTLTPTVEVQNSNLVITRIA